ncbi:MAG: single-stranded-DNA-specific exonuclease RecJ [Verrucomicrobia bacterium]|nr:single-stranded-DNA-specific exonuclease RecJ [Verrucomicrobiota bacterium]
MQKKWVLPPEVDSKLVARLADGLELPLPLAEVLVRRGYETVEAARNFLEPRLANLEAPEKIPGMNAAVERLQQAIEKKEQIVLYGDYDVDGVTSLAILTRFIKQWSGDVECFLPERASEGYGLSLAAIERCLKMHRPDLLIAIDCGTNSFAEAEFLKMQGVDLIIVDHHEPAPMNALEIGVALVNPKLGTAVEDHVLCSAGLVFKLCHAFLKRFPNAEIDLKYYLDFVALGTVADIAPLVGENRIFVRHGLRRLEKSQWPGVQALISVAEAKPPFSTIDIGFKLGPRINAAGRLTSAENALRLLLTENKTEASQIARQLDRLNRERQNIEREVTSEAEAWVEANLDLTVQKSIVVGQRDWHEGVVGIVASRLMKRWHRPALVIGFDEEGRGKGSGRSISGLPLVAALEACSSVLTGFGGHAMAAGLKLHESSFEEFKLLFEKSVATFLSEEDLIPSLPLDAEVDLAMLDHAWLKLQESLAPFGPSNPRPLFFTRGIFPAKEPRVLKEKHLRLEFEATKGKMLSAIFFDGALQDLPKPPWNLAFTIEENKFQGRSELQLKIASLRSLK